MDFEKNKLINQTLDKHFETWSHTMNTADFVPPEFLYKIDKIIFENLQKKLKEVEIFNLLHLQEKGFKLGLFQKLKIYFSGLKPLYLAEKDEILAQIEFLKQQALLDKNETQKEQDHDGQV